jgi:hypothetical protein
VLCCWVNGVLPGLKTQWSSWWISQRSQSSSIHVGRRIRLLFSRGANRSGRFLELVKYAVKAGEVSL